ncbi:cytochrome b [Sphingorhabdus sp.]|jgi:cytochrome b561|uniref:cytochrome b n=1 Tax=Sphingorhabdus sp. TaxID=1902408 RepID=UPI0037C9EBF4
MSVSSELPRRYSRVAILLHWLIAALMLFAIPLGLYSAENEGPLADQLTNIHKLVGIAILALTLVRIGWRLTHKPAPLSATIAPALRLAARTTHLVFYLLLLALPLSGWWMTSAFPKRHPFGVSGVFEVPFLPVEMSMASAGAAHEVHEVLGWLTIGLIFLHVAAALKHHFYDRDDILAWMLGAK